PLKIATVNFLQSAAYNLIIPAFCCLLISQPSSGDVILLNEPKPPPFIHTFQQTEVENSTELLISGTNKSNSQQTLIIRIDNESSSNYRSRVNKEFTLTQGPFELILPLSGLKTSGGQLFKQPYSKLFIFAADMWSDIELEKIHISTTNKLPEQTLALDFGSQSSAAFPGFKPIGKDSPYLRGKMTERVRSSGGALIRDGIVGIDNLQIPWPDGQWKLSLWAQDQGEWEYLPHFLTRQIIANKTSVIDEKLTREQWINNVYLAGNKKEGGIDGDLWTLVGERRSGLVTQNIEVTGGLLTIDLKGDYEARYLSALVLEPLDGNFAKATQAKRRERFLNKWPVASAPYSPPESLSLQDISQQVKDGEAFYPAARDSILNLTFEIESPFDDIAPVIIVSPPRSSDGKSLKVTTRYGHWRYERPTPNATSLILDDSYLRADMESIQLSSKRPRRLYVQVKIPTEAFSGDYSGKIQLFSSGELQLLDYKVKVLPIILPKLKASVGLYLEPAPFYQWFKSLKAQASSATACDLTLMAEHGFSTVAPALTTPGNETARKQFIQQLKQVKRFGFNGKVVAYSPLKRLLQQKSELSAGADLIQLKKLLKGQNLPELYWSLFDEPAQKTFPQIKSTANLLNDDSLQFKTAGHMNNERQAELAEVTDLLLINHGTEITEENINSLKENSTVWLYNMPKPRLAAGLYLWRSGAEGYLQWHGRMPTADPFDPTDGREGDVIYLYPSAGQCQKALDIHHRFIDLHEATIDLRWLQWLESESEKSAKAKQILSDIRNSIPSQWSDSSGVTNKDLLDIRNKIYSQILD
nr:hypothetical protein [Endozoicomonas sp.]